MYSMNMKTFVSMMALLLIAVLGVTSQAQGQDYHQRLDDLERRVARLERSIDKMVGLQESTVTALQQRSPYRYASYTASEPEPESDLRGYGDGPMTRIIMIETRGDYRIASPCGTTISAVRFADEPPMHYDDVALYRRRPSNGYAWGF